MNKSELAQLYWLKKEIRLEEDRLQTLKDGGETEAVQQKISNRLNRCTAQLLALEGYIDSIDDSMTRQIFVYRYAYGMNWTQTAHALGGYNTAEGVKKCCQRYIKKHPMPSAWSVM